MTKFIVACAVVVIAAGFAFSHAPHVPELSASASWDEQVAHWRERIHVLGGKSAYAEFTSSVAPLSATQRHTHVHAFGDALYKELGKSGLTVCDSNFNFGCYHQFFSDAIVALGPGVIPELDTACFQAIARSPLSCQHGIGHGILAANGYDDTALRASLKKCGELTAADPIGGCYGGVFMEYNVRTMLADKGTPREFKSDPFAPCDSLAADYLPACVYWQPQWWLQAKFRLDSPDKAYSGMGAYCAHYTGALRRDCFEGLGNIVTFRAGADAEKMAHLCDVTSNKPLDKLFCRATAANSLSVGGAGIIGDGHLVCKGLTGASKEYCDAYAENVANADARAATPDL